MPLREVAGNEPLPDGLNVLFSRKEFSPLAMGEGGTRNVQSVNQVVLSLAMLRHMSRDPVDQDRLHHF